MVAKYEGTRHGQLVVAGRIGATQDGRAMWQCTCSCGENVIATSKQLTKGTVRACKNCQDSGSRSPLSVRLSKYEISPSGCWNWLGKVNSHGYGVITNEGRYTRAHRAMFFMLNPDADSSMVVMHRCDNPRCVNPDHLALGTPRDNVLDMHSKGRFKGGAKQGNKNAVGNNGWMKGGATAKYVASKLGDEVDVPEGLA